MALRLQKEKPFFSFFLILAVYFVVPYKSYLTPCGVAFTKEEELFGAYFIVYDISVIKHYLYSRGNAHEGDHY